MDRTSAAPTHSRQTDHKITFRQTTEIAEMNATLRMFFHVPVIGWLLNDAINGAPDAKYYFAANLVFTFIALLYLFGYAFLIYFALTATAIVLITLIFLTAADMFDKRRRPVEVSARRRP